MLPFHALPAVQALFRAREQRQLALIDDVKRIADLYRSGHKHTAIALLAAYDGLESVYVMTLMCKAIGPEHMDLLLDAVRPLLTAKE